jgi:hypothetical protein
MFAHFFTAITFLEIHAFGVLLASKFSPDLIDFEDTFALPHEQVDEEGGLGFLLIELDLIGLETGCLGGLGLLLIIGLDVVDDLFLNFLTVAIFFGGIREVILLVLNLTDLLAIVQALPHLLTQIQIFGLDFILDFLDDGEGDLSEG